MKHLKCYYCDKMIKFKDETIVGDLPFHRNTCFHKWAEDTQFFEKFNAKINKDEEVEWPLVENGNNNKK